MNIYYIRAAILDRTGIKLSLQQVKDYLVSESLVRKSDADKLIFVGYGDYYHGTPLKVEDEPKEVFIDDAPEVIMVDEDVSVAVTVALNGVLNA